MDNRKGRSLRMTEKCSLYALGNTGGSEANGSVKATTAISKLRLRAPPEESGLTTYIENLVEEAAIYGHKHFLPNSILFQPRPPKCSHKLKIYKMSKN